MKLSVLLVSFAATALVLWVFVFMAEVQARPLAPHRSVAVAASIATADDRPVRQSGPATLWIDAG
jgi:hypothetical protein